MKLETEQIRDMEGISRHVESIMHELQIRLQAILAHAENLYNDLSEGSNARREDLQESAHSLLNAALSLQVVVQNLGKLSEDYWFRKESILPMLRACQDLYEAEARAKGVEIRICVDESAQESSILDISREHLQRALFNVVDNAVKYSFQGTAEHPRWIDVTGRRGDRHYSIAVRNYGVGILEHEHDKIFEDGYRGELTRGEHRTGTGRGLYVAREIIRNHGGTIEVSSESVGRAYLTTFTIHLPLSRDAGGGME